MFARIEGGVCAAYPVSPQADHPNTGFPWDWAGGEVGGVEYARVAPVDVPQSSLTQTHAEGMPVLLDGVWTQTYGMRDLTPEEIAQAQHAKLQEYQTALDAHVESIAQARNYNSAASCASYALDPNPTWAAEGRAFINWRSTTYIQAFSLLAAVQSGQLSEPTVLEMLSNLPQMEWPT